MNTTPTIKHLIIVNVLFFALDALGIIPNLQRQMAIHYVESPSFAWWQVFSYMFAHGGVAHLFFNMYALYSMGRPLEMLLGSNRFMVFYFTCGIGAVLLHTGVNYYQFHSVLDVLTTHGYTQEFVYDTLSQGKYATDWKGLLSNELFTSFMQSYYTPTLGASGAVYGVLAAFGLLFPNAELVFMFIPYPIKAKYFIPIIVGIDLFSGVTGFSIFGGGVAHFAHVGGAVFGFLLILLWRKNSFNGHRLY